MIGTDGYYSLRALLGYSDCTYFFCLSDRGRGKSYGCKHFLMSQDGEFMCIYRNTADMEHAITDWVDPLIHSKTYTREQFEWDGGKKNGYTLLVNGTPKGYFRALTQTNHIKQEFFPDTLNWVWFDEFIPIVKKKLSGVESEGDCIRTIMKTIDHDTAHPRETRGLKRLKCILFGNAHTWDNEILQYFHIDPTLGYGIHRMGPGVVCEILEPYNDKKDGKMTVDDFIGREVNLAQGWMNDTAYVVDRRADFCNPWASIRYGKHYYGVYKRGECFYVETCKGHINGGYVIGTLDGLIQGERTLEDSRVPEHLVDLIQYGHVYFVGLNTKMSFLRDYREN